MRKMNWKKLRKTDLGVPSPPKPPRGRWRSSNTSLSRMLGGFNSLGGSPLVDLPSLIAPSYMRGTPRRDPNAFYYKPTRITEPAETFSLECEQWRHGTSSEAFIGDIFVKEGVTKSSGALGMRDPCRESVQASPEEDTGKNRARVPKLQGSCGGIDRPTTRQGISRLRCIRIQFG